MRVLVTGGAGYIGSHIAAQLVSVGYEPLIVDDFSNAHPAVLDRLATITGRPVRHRELDLTDGERVDDLFAHEQIDAVIHLAGFKAVGESVENPLAYYRTNVGGTLTLLDAMRRHDVDLLIFSSSATVYGADSPSPMPETAPTRAASPYGWTKIMIEQIVHDTAACHSPQRVAVLRYFNPVGAHPSGLIGEDPRGVPNNLVPYLAQVAAGRRPVLRIFGADYPTRDGTCERDYIHVEDLAAGHLAALDALRGGRAGVRTWNLGTGRATSVREMVAAFERAADRAIPQEVVGRRPGDSAVAYADVRRAQAELGWAARRSIDDMCADVWRWQQRNPDGYGSGTN